MNQCNALSDIFFLFNYARMKIGLRGIENYWRPKYYAFLVFHIFIVIVLFKKALNHPCSYNTFCLVIFIKYADQVWLFNSRMPCMVLT